MICQVLKYHFSINLAIELNKKERKNVRRKKMEQNNNWGTENIDNKDVYIPRINLAQALSEVVSEGTGVKPGDFYDTISRKKIENVEIVLFKFFKTWQVLKKVAGKNKPEYIETVPFTVENSNWSWSEGDIIRNLTFNFYVLLAKDGKIINSTPYLMTFSRTSLNAGKTITTKLTELRSKNLPIAGITFIIGSELKKNDNGKYYVTTVKPGKFTTSEEMIIAKEWHEGSGALKIEDKKPQPAIKNETPVLEEIDESDIPF